MLKGLKLINLSIVICFFIGCREIPPAIDYSQAVLGLKDTSYVSSAPNSVFKLIYIEDITGVRCNNCPKAAQKIHQIDSLNPNITIGVGVYASALANFTTPYAGFESMLTPEADDIFKEVYANPGALPTGGVNRKLFNGESTLFVSYNNWGGYADIVKAEESPCVITTKVLQLDSIARKVKVSLKIAFAKAYLEPLNYTVFITENNIVSKQTMPDGKGKDDYVHNHVLRKAITPYNGSPLKIKSIGGNYEAGRVFEKELEIPLDQKWKIKDTHIVVLVNRFDAGSKEVLQAAELKLH